MSKQTITAPYIKLTDSDHDTNLDLAPDDERPVSENLKDITLYGSKLAVLVAFDASSLSDISLKTHLIPLAKELKVKHRSMRLFFPWPRLYLSRSISLETMDSVTIYISPGTALKY